MISDLHSSRERSSKLFADCSACVRYMKLLLVIPVYYYRNICLVLSNTHTTINGLTTQDGMHCHVLHEAS